MVNDRISPLAKIIFGVMDAESDGGFFYFLLSVGRLYTDFPRIFIHSQIWLMINWFQ